MHDLTHTTHEQLLNDAMRAKVDDLEPRDCLHAVLNTAHASRRFRRWALAAVTFLLILAGLLYAANNSRESEPQRLPVHVTRLLEA